MHLRWIGVVLLGTLWVSAAAASATPPLVSFVAERQAYRATVTQLLLQRQFETLETQARELRAQRPRFSAGLQRLYDFYEALTPPAEASPQTVEQRLQLLQQWRAQWPKSGAPMGGLARVHLVLAWQARGGGWASSVTPEGWQGFREHSRQAVEWLEDAPLHTAGDAALYNLLFWARRDAGRPRADVEEAFRLGTAVDPTYDQLYNSMAAYLLPRWHGRPGELEAFAARAADQTKAWIGDGMYLRVAINALLVDREASLRLYTFSWPRLKRGLRDLDRAFPNSSRTVNYMGYLACLYQDAPLAAEALGRLGDSWDGDAQEAWGTPATKAACRH